MVSSQRQTPQRASGDTAIVGRLFLLDLSDNRVVSVNPDGSDRKVIVTGCRYPDGIVVDVAAGHIYWTNMGNPKANDGSIERADLDGRNRKTIVPPGGTFTPKQIQLEKESGKLYWCEREGMRVTRANLDGSNVETLVDASQGDPRPGPDATKWWAWPSMLTMARSTGRKRVPTTQARAAFSAPASTFPQDRQRPIDQISKFSTTGLPSRSIWTSI
jgi:hypothetical protein